MRDPVAMYPGLTVQAMLEVGLGVYPSQAGGRRPGVDVNWARFFLRPSLVLARNPNRRGVMWPARICDKEEVRDRHVEKDLDGGGRVSMEHVIFVRVFTACNRARRLKLAPTYVLCVSLGV